MTFTYRAAEKKDSMRLAELTRENARKSGYESLSLIVFAGNAPALALYRSLDFEPVQKIKLESNQFIPHQGGCMLLACQLSKNR